MTAAQQVAQTFALSLQKAQTEYEKAYLDFLNTLEPLDDDTFWKMLDFLRNLLIERGIKGPALSRAVDELFRLPAFWRGCERGTCGGGSDPGYTTIDAIRFAETYDAKKDALYNPLFDVVEGRGDDGYGDLLDSLVLLGRDLYTKCVGDGKKSDIGNNRSFETACNKAAADLTGDVAKAEALAKFVLRGENYVEMSLRDEGRKRFVNFAADEVRDAED